MEPVVLQTLFLTGFPLNCVLPRFALKTLSPCSELFRGSGFSIWPQGHLIEFFQECSSQRDLGYPATSSAGFSSKCIPQLLWWESSREDFHSIFSSSAISHLSVLPILFPLFKCPLPKGTTCRLLGLLWSCGSCCSSLGTPRRLWGALRSEPVSLGHSGLSLLPWKLPRVTLLLKLETFRLRPPLQTAAIQLPPGACSLGNLADGPYISFAISLLVVAFRLYFNT